MDQQIAFTTASTPGPGLQSWDLPGDLASRPFTVRWTGTVHAAFDGDYAFRLRADENALLSINGETLIELRGGVVSREQTESVFLAARYHFVELYYAQMGFGAQVTLLYAPPGARTFEPIPPERVNPLVGFSASARRVTFDDLTPGVYITDQLRTRYGIRFATQEGPGAFFASRPSVRRTAVGTSSLPNLLMNDSYDALEAVRDVLSSNVPLTIRFDEPQARVRCAVGTEVDPFPDRPPSAVLRAYNALGELVGADRVEAAPQRVSHRLQVGRGIADITLITVDFGDFGRGERIDDLMFETIGAPPSDASDRISPVVEVLTPTHASGPLGSLVQIEGIVHEESGLLDTIELLPPDGSISWAEGVADDCHMPFCRGFRGSIVLPAGHHTLTVRARDAAGNIGIDHVNVTVLPIRIQVVDEDGRPVEDADVYANEEPLGRTDAAGRLELHDRPLLSMTRLAARKCVHEARFSRSRHNLGSDQNWKFRTYITNVALSDTGTFQPEYLVDPAAVQVLTLRRTNVLIGVNLVASIQWDATEAEFEKYAAIIRGLRGASAETNLELFGEESPRFQGASGFMFNATDGQIFIEQIHILDNGRWWDSSDFKIRANANTRAKVDRGDTFWDAFGRNNAWMNMARRYQIRNWDGDKDWNVGNDCKVYIHEFGHYGFALDDEYRDNHPEVGCTLRALSPIDRPFRMSRPFASCIMWNQGVTYKICSDHPDNPHAHGTEQGRTPCWDVIARRYRDRTGEDQWIVQTPKTRGVILGQINHARLPADWIATRVETTNRDDPNLCEPIEVEFLRENGRGMLIPVENTEVYTISTRGRVLLQGKTLESGPKGRIIVAGIHAGDWIVAAESYPYGRIYGSFQVADSCIAESIGETRSAVAAAVAEATPPSGRAHRIVLGTAPFELSLAAEPTAEAGRTQVRIHADAELAAPPTVSLHLSGPQAPLPLPVKFDPESGSYFATIEKQSRLLDGTVVVRARDVDGRSALVIESITILPFEAGNDAEVSIFSADGVVELELPNGALLEGDPVVIGPSAATNPQLPLGFVEVVRPVRIRSARDERLAHEGVLRFRLPESAERYGVDGYDASSFQILRYNERDRHWIHVGGTLLPDVGLVSAPVAELGDYVLAARPLPAPDRSADFDADGDVDENDGQYLVDCIRQMSQNSQSPSTEQCADADLNADTVVDCVDHALFAAAFTGPGILPECSLSEESPYLVHIVDGLGGVNPQTGVADTFVSPRREQPAFTGFALLASEPLLPESVVATYTGQGNAPHATLRHTGANRHWVSLDPAPDPGAWLRLDLDVRGESSGERTTLTVWVAHHPGDVNQDGVVDIRDATRFGELFRHRPSLELLDLNGDDAINVRDATAFGNLWHGSGSVTRAWRGSRLPAKPNTTAQSDL